MITLTLFKVTQDYFIRWLSALIAWLVASAVALIIKAFDQFGTGKHNKSR